MILWRDAPRSLARSAILSRRAYRGTISFGDQRYPLSPLNTAELGACPSDRPYSLVYRSDEFPNVQSVIAAGAGVFVGTVAGVAQARVPHIFLPIPYLPLWNASPRAVALAQHEPSCERAMIDHVFSRKRVQQVTPHSVRCVRNPCPLLLSTPQAPPLPKIEVLPLVEALSQARPWR